MESGEVGNVEAINEQRIKLLDFSIHLIHGTRQGSWLDEETLDIVTMMQSIDQAKSTMTALKKDVLEPRAKQALERGRKTLENVFMFIFYDE